jgi:hypothetical protein
LIQRLDPLGDSGRITPRSSTCWLAVSDLNVDSCQIPVQRTGRPPRWSVDPAFAGSGARRHRPIGHATLTGAVRREVAYGMTADGPAEELTRPQRRAPATPPTTGRWAPELANGAPAQGRRLPWRLGAGQPHERINLIHGDAESTWNAISDTENADLTEAITRMSQDWR